MNLYPVSDGERMESLKFSKDAVIIFEEESKKISHELAKSGEPYSVIQIVTDFFNRLSVSFENQQAKENIPIACREGCSFCCRDNTVKVFLPEVLAIANFLNESFDETRLENVKKKLRLAVLKTKGSSGKGIGRIYQQCALLEGNQCSIYEIRPSNCRQFHSLDLKWCENKYINPAANIPDTTDPDLKQKLHGAIAGFEDAFKQAGFAMKRYELNQLLSAVLDDPVIVKNWIRNQK
jgi:Fe-S-cluster containining protein